MNLIDSFLVACVTYQVSEFIYGGLEKSLVLLILAVLIFFVMDRSSAIFGAVTLSVLCFSGCALAVVSALRSVGLFSRTILPVDEPFLPLRFQRPPPALPV